MVGLSSGRKCEYFPFLLLERGDAVRRLIC
jgi:hypothetical protein